MGCCIQEGNADYVFLGTLQFGGFLVIFNSYYFIICNVQYNCMEHYCSSIYSPLHLDKMPRLLENVVFIMSYGVVH